MDPWRSRRVADLDVVDITQDLTQSHNSLSAQIATEEARIHAIASELLVLSVEVARAQAEPPANHPASDDWDDNYWRQRALNETGYGHKHRELESAKSAVSDLLEERRRLSEFEDPRVEVAKGVIVFGWEYLQSLGLSDKARRQASSPTSLAGLALAEVVWETRNQIEHVTSPRKQVVTAFEAIVNAYPAEFGIATTPASATTVEAVLQQKPWAREILILLGWTNRRAAASGLLGIR